MNTISTSDRRRGGGRGAKILGVPRWRYYALVISLGILPVAALWQIARLQVVSDIDRGFEFLQGEGDARMVRTEEIPGYRGLITDRRGKPLAVSTPVVSLWADPQIFKINTDQLAVLADKLKVTPETLMARLAAYVNKEFMYLARRITPDEANEILALGLPGVFRQSEYKRYYPAAEVTAQLVGFTNIDDVGQEGLELAYEDWLSGRSGAKQVLKDRRRRIIKDLRLLRSEKPGNNLALSIDLRLQYSAYRELKAAISKFRATSGSVVVLDVLTGEVLAMVNQPSFNPNDRSRLNTSAMRNRAVTDLIEPGSTIKPLTVVAALETGKFDSQTRIDTHPGYLRVGGKTFVDPVNYGLIDITRIITKSSQVGITKIALALQPEQIRDVFARVGFGQTTGVGFPGESPGSLPNKPYWRPVERANFAFGHGLSVTPLQLARAYLTLAGGGKSRPLSLLKTAQNEPGLVPSEAVIDADIAESVRVMMKTVTEKGGTGTRAAIPGYQVAGKTGTVHKVGASGYQQDRYVSLFAGMVPANNPRLVTVVIVNDPRSQAYFGGLVAAPVFARVTTDALRLLNIQPDSGSSEKLTSGKSSFIQSAKRDWGMATEGSVTGGST
jgi:cell division protein FtsI (penicillin-binding protein 3)